jgi:hypothetical protein
MNLSAQEYLAKLLAKENLSVQHGNYSTASFDVMNRVLRLPLWEDKGKDVYDLLVGHEVGHALYTPADGWHDSEKKIGKIPRAYLNIVEDIRIERKIQETYPGIVRRFKSGYKRLFDDNLFGTDDREINEAGLMDRLNVSSKGRGYIPVEFSDEEAPLVKEAMEVKTWEDVLKVCKKFYDFIEENKEEEEEKPEGTGADFPSNDMDGDDDAETENPQGTTPPEDGDDEDTDGEDGDADSEGEGEKTKEPVEPGHETWTDDNFRENENELLEKKDDRYEEDKQSEYSSGISKANLKNMLFTYEEADLARTKHILQDIDYDQRDSTCYTSEACKNDWEKSKAGLNSTASLLAKDFERKKAAFEYSRATTAKSGKLDPLKLHSYKMTEDIFLTTTRLAQAKSHGIIMFMDLSGSMCEIIEDVTMQAITIAMFCKKVNIPFECYNFTTSSWHSSSIREVEQKGGEIDIKSSKVVEMFSSKMNTKTFNEACYTMFAISKAHSYSRSTPYYLSGRNVANLDQMGSTPLIQTTFLAAEITKAFQRKHAIQNTNIMFLTDGVPDGIYVEKDEYADVKTHRSNKMINFGGKMIQGEGSREIYENALLRLKELTGATIMGFHLATDASSFGQGLYGIDTDDKYGDYVDFRETIKTWRKEKFSEYKKAKGYDNYFIIKIDRKKLEDEFVLPEGKTELKDIKREFRKFSKSKKATKQLIGKITDAVAA